MKKRATFILVIVSLLASIVFAVACNGTPKACEHEGGTATCIRRAVCEKCGEEYGDLAAHVYGEWRHDGIKHWKECTTEGCTSKSEEGNHTGGTATCEHKAVCTACGEEYGELADHAYTEWKHDETGHWKECACGKKSDKTDHNYGAWKHDETGHWKECECGAQLTKSDHAFGAAWENDGTQHWKECECGAKSEVADHAGGTATCERKAVCEACGEEYGELAQHTYGDNAWKHDGTQHWQECDVCGTATEKTDHVFGEWKHDADGHWKECACGAKSEEGAHAYGEWQHDGTKHWKECACGVKSEEAAHAYTEWKEDDAQHWQECTCGAATEKENHAYGDTWAHDETKHWKVCTAEGCSHKSEEGNHAGGTATCQQRAACETCGEDYGELAAHAFGEWKSDDAKHWKECTTDGCAEKSEEGNHAYDSWDKSDAAADYKVCECGVKDVAHPFDKKVARITQKLLLTDTTLTLNLVGVGEYASVESITFGEYDLGTNLNSLTISDELKADTVHHGKQVIVVTVKDAENGMHEVRVPVTLITKEISSAADFKAIQPSAATKGVYGYYVLTSDFQETTLSANSYCGDWDTTTGFFGTFDGQGHTITAAANGNGGLFGILRNATIKNLTIKDMWRTSGQYCALLAKASFNSTLENVTFAYVNGKDSNMNLGNGFGWLCYAEFSNNTLINVTVDDSKGYGSLFGYKFAGNVFNNVVINGTYTEMGHTADDRSVSFDDVTKGEQVRLTERQDFVLDGKVSVIDLGEYSDCEILSITTSTGYELYTLSSDAVNDVFKAAKQAHGEQDFVIKVSRGGEVIIVTVPVTVITKEITSAADFKAIQPSSATKGVYGYYVLTTDISDNTLAQNAYADDWAATTGFFGTFDGQGHTISTAANGAKGIFGILRGATIKNLTITDNWRSAYQNYALLAKACFNSTIKDVTFTYVAGNTQSNVGNGYGWLSCAEFSNNTLVNVTVNDTQGYGSLFGYKFTGNVFDNVTINGTYTEMGHTASGESVSYDDVTKAGA